MAITRGEFEPDICGVAVPVFGVGGQMVASLELSLRDLGTELQPRMAALVIAARCVLRELPVPDATRMRLGTAQRPAGTEC